MAAEAAEEALTGPNAFLEAHQRAVMGGAYASRTERWEAFSLGACEVVSMPYKDACEAIATTSGRRRLQLLIEALEPAVREMSALASLDSLDGMFGGEEGFGLGSSMAPPGGGGGAPPATGLAGGSTGVAAGANARPSQFGGTTAFTPIDIPVGDSAGNRGAGVTGGGPVGDGGRGSPLSQPELEFDEGTRIEYWWDPELQWLSGAPLTTEGTRRDARTLLPCTPRLGSVPTQ